MANHLNTNFQRAIGIDFPEVKKRQEKEEAFARLNAFKIPEVLEELLNKACRLKPNDLFGYMSESFRLLSEEPVISSLSAFEGLDSNSKKSVEVDLYCNVCNVNKLLSKSSLSLDPNNLTLPGAQQSTPRKTSSKKQKGSGGVGGSPTPQRIGSPPGVSPRRDNVPSLGSIAEKKLNCTETVTEISKALKGLPVRKQQDIDRALESLRAAKAAADKVIFDPISLLAVSCAVAEAGSHLSSHPLFLYLSRPSHHHHHHHHHHQHHNSHHRNSHSPSLSPGPVPACSVRVGDVGGRGGGGGGKGKQDLNGGDREVEQLISMPAVQARSSRGLSLPIPPPPSRPPQKFSMPFPVVAMLGPACAGKLKGCEFSMCPLPCSLSMPQQLRMLEKIYSELGKIVMSKLGGSSRVTLPNGAYSSSLDRLEQGLDLIKEATGNAGFQFSVDVGVMIQVGSEAIYDEDKGKYEITSSHPKTSDEMINMYCDLLQHGHSGILGFIDPLNSKDIAGWKKLISKVANKCLLVADGAIRNGLPLMEESQAVVKKKTEGQKEGSAVKLKVEDSADLPGIDNVSCAALTWENSLSSTMDKIDHLKGCCLHVMLTAPPNLTVNTVLADLAVASDCRFIKLGAPVGMVTLLLNRLLHIHEELMSRKLLEPAEDFLLASPTVNKAAEGQ